MADIVVFRVDDPTLNEDQRRQHGMRRLGEVFNKHFTDPALDADEVVNRTIQEMIADPKYIVTYLDPANILSRKGASANKYHYKPADPSAVLRLRGTRDRFEQGDGEAVDVMHIAISGGNADLLAPDNYLSRVMKDLGIPAPTLGQQKYLLGTITFRRCR